ncbi:MAG TPA: Crp/Fnr family transcriptional regulator [Pirellulales bacterium]|nr:Crp/Fnr family transcriptional regulator [Pirellulales bacterium]
MMEKQAIDDLLRQLGFTAGLPDPVLDELASVSAVVRFPAGATIFREETKNPFVYVVERGHVGLDMHVPTRGRVRILSVGPGEMLAWSALLGDSVMTVSAVALEDTQAVAICGSTLAKLCSTNHEAGYLLMRRMATSLAQRLTATRLQLLDLFAEPTVAASAGLREE